jgi:large subunit ribosomal protein L25
MEMSNAITAVKREKTGSLNALRKQGQIPAILYGKGLDPVKLAVDYSEAQKHVHSNGFVDLNVAGKTHRVMVRDIQKDPIQSSILHIDFLKVEMNEPLHVEVPVHLTGEAAGVKSGGILEQHLRLVEVKALPSDIPESIDVDVSHLQVGDSLLLKDIKMPDGVELLHFEPETTVATVVPPAKSEDIDNEETAVDTDKDEEETK